MDKRFISNLIIYLQNQKITKEELAEKMNMSADKLYGYLRGRYSATKTFKLRVCAALDIPIEELDKGEVERTWIDIDNTPLKVRLAQNLNYYGYTKKMTWTELSLRSGVNVSTIDNYRNAKVNSPSISNIGAIAKALGIRVEDLLN